MAKSIDVNEDLIIDSAEVTCDVEIIEDGCLKQVHQVVAYPTKATRDLTKSLPNTTTDWKQIAERCRWVTPGIVRFFVRPSTRQIAEARPLLGSLEISLQTILNEGHKRQLADEAKKMYHSLPITVENIRICPFRQFLAELQIAIHGTKRKFYGSLMDINKKHPLHIHFDVSDKDDLKDIVRQLAEPDENEFLLQYYYTLTGTSTAHANVRINAEQVAKCQLVNDIFGDSQKDSMIVSRSYLERLSATIMGKLSLTETIGVGATEINCDLIKQAVINSITSGFEKYSIDELRQQLASGTKCISDDLKADITTSYEQSHDNKKHRRQETAHEYETSDLNDAKTQNTENRHEIEKKNFLTEGSAKGNGWGVQVDLQGKRQTDATRDLTTSKDVRDDAKTEERFSTSSKGTLDREQAEKQSSTISGTKINAKTIDAAIIDRWRFVNGFTISLDRWVHQMSSTYVTGRLTNRDVSLPLDLVHEGLQTSIIGPRGDFCGIIRADNILPETITETDLRNSFNILLAGKTGTGKSTLINLLHNYFLNSSVNEMQRIVDPQSERHDRSMMSVTSTCVRYVYRSVDGDVYQIIDSPGLADTSGDEEDDKNIQIITAVAEKVQHIHCIVFVCNGTGDNRASLDIRTTFVLLKNNLPTAVLDNIVAFFTFTDVLESNKCDLNEFLRLDHRTSLVDVESMPKFCADSSFFGRVPSNASPSNRKIYERKQQGNYELACEQLDNLLVQIRKMRRVSTDVFSAVTESRHRIMANIATIKVQLDTTAELVTLLESAKRRSSQLHSKIEASKDFKKCEQIQRPEQVTVPYKNTLCTIHCCNCHIKCELEYIEGVGSMQFQNCTAFNRKTTCSHPDCAKSRGGSKCTYEHHYHDYKEWRIVEKTIEKIYENMRDEYYKYLNSKQLVDDKIDLVEEEKKILQFSFDCALEDLLEACQDMKQKVKGYNLVAYIDILLESLNKKIKEIDDVEKRGELNGKISFFKQLLSSLENPRTTRRLTYRRPFQDTHE
ncbi:unnamed protein product [Adineta ricciae]|uniref:AIG1-type G domain-containing protein n=1 Tax=Adineta ricciae TaxID=249248 RepID=A0A816BK32_ADIRI|nr:unnamed protein product [Adineta ricciae]CAF1611827.1 unnamed protein product [Adineta ricciae]